MKIFIGGQILDLTSLDPVLDDEFVALYSAYWGAAGYRWKRFVTASQGFFSEEWQDYEKLNSYFVNATPLWNRHLASRDYDGAEQLWGLVLEPALSWEQKNPGKLLHKGTPYYFWAMTALLRGDIDRGYILMHRAVAEDVRTLSQPIPNTPAYAFVSLDYVQTSQAFHAWLLGQADYLEQRMRNYRTKYTRTLGIEGFRIKFLKNPPSPDVGFLLAHTVARLMRLSGALAHGSMTSFTAQIEANVLFDLILLVDECIKHKNPSKWKFVDHVNFIAGQFNAGFSQSDLSHVNSEFTKDAANAVSQVLDRNFIFPNGNVISEFQADVCVAYGLRNAAAHGVSAIQPIAARFAEVEQAIFNVIFAAVDKLY